MERVEELDGNFVFLNLPPSANVNAPKSQREFALTGALSVLQLFSEEANSHFLPNASLRGLRWKIKSLLGEIKSPLSIDQFAGYAKVYPTSIRYFEEATSVEDWLAQH